MITRFAPSPTGPLHLGHAYSALLNFDMARQEAGQFLLRIEDLDQTRSRPEWSTQIMDDLSWLGLHWAAPPITQSARMHVYQEVLAQLWDRGLLYECRCSRADIRHAVEAPQEGTPQFGPDGLIYPGTCRPDHPPQGPMPPGVLRLDMARALDTLNAPLSFVETGASENGQSGLIQPDDLIGHVGDVVLARRDFGASYHLAVVVDDAHQNITHVIRGQDLFEATLIHVLLQQLLGYPVPTYHHHRLIRDEDGKRLAKRHDSKAIAKFRAEGASPDDIRRMVGL